jgi:hypothetical protein
LSTIAENLFSESNSLNKDSNFLDKVTKIHSKTAQLFETQSRTSSEREAISLRYLLRFQQFQKAFPSFPTDMVIELIYESQIEF